MKKHLFLLMILLGSIYISKAQDKYQAYYPIGDDPNVEWKSTMTSAKKYETILFEANPIVRYSIINNIYKLANQKNGYVKAWYVSFRPQLRMYTENSLPVKTPSYKILAGTQHFWRVFDKDLIGFSLESGHYSNGQNGGAFTDKYADDSPESNAIYKTITPSTDLSSILNRKSANFSTDLTELIGNIRFNKLDSSFVPLITNSFKLGGVLYHDKVFGVFDAGGYSDDDIKIYGKFRLIGGYQYTQQLKNLRYAVTFNFERIFNAHRSVEPWRAEVIATLYPLKCTPDFGVFVTGIAGHDNYNYRFVDSGHQFGIGILWTLFPPIKIKNAASTSHHGSQ